jgi:hypothetical protein
MPAEMLTAINSLEELAAREHIGYAAEGPTASEPTALAALALLASDRPSASKPACEWLVQHQNADGSVGVTQDQAEPCWPTSLAILAWETAVQRKARPGVEALRPAVRSALGWLMSIKGEALRRNPQFGHDTTLVGWPWVVGTHSWMEPTAFAVLAFRATGNSAHARCTEAVRLLIDRQLSTGGANYGNTFVLGQELLPHTLPSAISLLALANLGLTDARVVTSLFWLTRAVEHERGTPSLCFGLLALAAHNRPHSKTADLIAAAEERLARRQLSGYQLALLAHAQLGNRSPLIPPRQEVAKP